MQGIFRSAPFILLLFGLVGCWPSSSVEKCPSPPDVELAVMFAAMRDGNDTLPKDYPERFERRLEEILCDPATVGLPFDSLRASGMEVVVSDDGRMKIFHWLHPRSGQAWRVPAVAQVRTAAGTVVVGNLRGRNRADNEYWHYENSPIIDYARLHYLTDSLWLAIGAGQVDGMSSWRCALGLQLKNGAEIVLGIPLFDEGSDSLASEVELPLTWYDFHPDRKGDLAYPEIHFDPQKHEIAFPAMAVPDRDTTWIKEPRGDTIHLRFNGRFFEEM